jgi:hypothetical protein
MARPALLVGRTLADTARNTFVVLLMVAVGYAVGFRFHAGPAAALAALALPLTVGYLLSWISALIGLTVRDPETPAPPASCQSSPWPSPAPPSCPWPPCPAGCKPGANSNPITDAAATRALALGGPPAARSSRPSPGSSASSPSSSPWPSTATAASPNKRGCAWTCWAGAPPVGRNLWVHLSDPIRRSLPSWAVLDPRDRPPMAAAASIPGRHRRNHSCSLGIARSRRPYTRAKTGRMSGARAHGARRTTPAVSLPGPTTRGCCVCLAAGWLRLLCLPAPLTSGSGRWASGSRPAWPGRDGGTTRH